MFLKHSVENFLENCINDLFLNQIEPTMNPEHISKNLTQYMIDL